MDIFRQSRQNGTRVEKLVLDAVQDIAEAGNAAFQAGLPGHPDERVQFVDRAVGFEAEGVFWDALASHERRLAGVTTPGVDPVDGEAGFIKLRCIKL